MNPWLTPKVAVKKLNFEGLDPEEGKHGDVKGCQSQSVDYPLTGNIAADEKGPGSPVLLRKCNESRRTPRSPSPVLLSKPKKRKVSEPDLERENGSIDDDGSESDSECPASPVLQYKKAKSNQNSGATIPPKSPILACRYVMESQLEGAVGSLTGGKSSQHVSARDESDDTRISVFSSESKAVSEPTISEFESRGSGSYSSEIPVNVTPTEEGNQPVVEMDSGKKRKRPKKNGFVARLFELRKKQASAKRIREHESKIMKARGTRWKSLCVVNTWRHGPHTLFKCREVNVEGDDEKCLRTNDRSIVERIIRSNEYAYVIVDSMAEKYFARFTTGTIVRIAAPWQEVRLPKLKTTVYMSVNSFELTEMKLHVNPSRLLLREICISPYKEDIALLFDALHVTKASTFLS